MIKNIFVFASKIRLKADDLNDIMDSITRMLNSKPIDDEIYKAILYFINNQKKFDNITNEYLFKLIILFLRKLINVEFNQQNGGFEIEAIEQHNFIDIISRFVKKDNNVIEDSLLDNIIKSIEGGELRNHKQTIIEGVLIPLYPLVSIDLSDKIKNVVNSQRELPDFFHLKIQSPYHHVCKIVA